MTAQAAALLPRPPQGRAAYNAVVVNASQAAYEGMWDDHVVWTVCPPFTAQSPYLSFWGIGVAEYP